ncbi:MAG: HD domain-containing protein [Lachnospiraceae bacterium]|nr:HD domain-containing protein [Lachnospiraceae bacterium]
MVTTAYGICLLISIVVFIYTAGRKRDNIDPYYCAVVVLIPVVILGYWLKTRVITEEGAMIAFCFIYLDSTILPVIMINSMLRSLHVKVRFRIKLLTYSLAFIHLFIVWTSIHNSRYFKTIRLIRTDAGTVTKMTSGPLKIFHLIYLAAIVAGLIGIMIAGFLRKGTYSRKTHRLYTVAVSLAILVYAVETLIDISFSMLPFMYVIYDVVAAASYDRIYAHNISSVISTQQKLYGNRGYAAFDLNRRFLSCNRRCYDFLPELSSQVVDELLPDDTRASGILYSLINAYESRGTSIRRFRQGDMTCVCEIGTYSFSMNGKTDGYLFDIRDATEEQKAMDLMSSYNESLNEQVKIKTENIRDIQGKIVAGMANMIENRDSNTGGHVKRTSDIIKILVEEIKRQGILDLDEEFARDVVRAAPMHDLGKITIEDSILNKPDKLTDEEYEIMKSHPVKSGEVVHILLDGVEEEHFVKLAFNVARYHHERWDGKGYPEHLVGTMIPTEARIMAVVDVYDALVSKRSYKDAMSFETVADIMYEGMGTQFDPNLRSAFRGCRDKLEAYYMNLRETSSSK